MIIYLKEDYILRTPSGRIIETLKAGTKFTAIHPSYISNFEQLIESLFGYISTDMLSSIPNDLFFVYYKRQYIFIPTYLCDAPLIDGGWFNR